MCAHSLTIARQCLARNPDTDPEGFVQHAIDALDPPGMDPISHPSLRMEGPGLDLYGDLYCAANGLIDPNGANRYGHDPIPVVDRVPFVKRALEAIVVHCAHLEHYRSLEAADSAFRLFVKRGRPHWRKRREIWDGWGPIIASRPPQPEDYYRN